MKVLAITSQKGGSGKTTLAGHIAVEADRAGAGPVAIVDTDPQGSLTDWWNEREAAAPSFVQAQIETLEADLQRARDHGFKLVVIDTPPAITGTIERVIGLADLIAVPTRPSPHDLRAVGTTIEMVESQDKPLVFVVNAANPRARITSEAAIVLSQHGTIAPVTIHQRTDFAAAMIDGRTVMEIERAERSRDEIVKLWAYLDGRLNGTSHNTVMPSSFANLPGERAPDAPAKAPVGAFGTTTSAPSVPHDVVVERPAAYTGYGYEPTGALSPALPLRSSRHGAVFREYPPVSP
jgi:chromosome partitioning protein